MIFTTHQKRSDCMEEREVIALLKDKKMHVGTKETLRLVSQGKIKSVLIASNCPDNVKSDLKEQSAEVMIFDGNSKELGIICGKPFNIAVVGLE